MSVKIGNKSNRKSVAMLKTSDLLEKVQNSNTRGRDLVKIKAELVKRGVDVTEPTPS